jgi:hypothetical protein
MNKHNRIYLCINSSFFSIPNVCCNISGNVTARRYSTPDIHSLQSGVLLKCSILQQIAVDHSGNISTVEYNTAVNAFNTKNASSAAAALLVGGLVVAVLFAPPVLFHLFGIGAGALGLTLHSLGLAHAATIAQGAVIAKQAIDLKSDVDNVCHHM